LVVKMWCIVWWMWCFSSRFLRLEKYARLGGFIFWVFPFGNEAGVGLLFFSRFPVGGP
jgi:hypothetical protein